jgi:hypothetical protein
MTWTLYTDPKQLGLIQPLTGRGRGGVYRKSSDWIIDFSFFPETFDVFILRDQSLINWGRGWESGGGGKYEKKRSTEMGS